jgi:hypothetical protein
MPDGLWVAFVLLMVFLLGMMAGFTLSMSLPRLPLLPDSYQHRLDALEQRVRTLEQR